MGEQVAEPAETPRIGRDVQERGCDGSAESFKLGVIKGEGDVVEIGGR